MIPSRGGVAVAGRGRSRGWQGWPHCFSTSNTDWNKYDDRLMKAVERGEVDKVAAVLNKKGIIPTKLDVEGRSA
ncbi:unnamed protein product [Menidia menidia]|uniref:(Atlantic silverside) hypothetical protein n=1 Tax=Menidia menidia TaxID=238744 RepID=A0A8S4AD47_9TELE|nr:unnamed protein product [Menidia menidia]